jgi:hypothetical protein
MPLPKNISVDGRRGQRMIHDFHIMQVLGFEKIREEYLKAVPVFGL